VEDGRRQVLHRIGGLRSLLGARPTLSSLDDAPVSVSIVGTPVMSNDADLHDDVHDGHRDRAPCPRFTSGPVSGRLDCIHAPSRIDRVKCQECGRNSKR
jgi:hypothetical protein